MSKLIEIHVVSTERLIFSGSFSAIFAPAQQGEVGIFPGHIPFLSLLKPGCLVMRHEDNKQEYCYIGGGVIEVQPFCVTVLAYNALKTKELDEKLIQEAKENALRLLSGSNQKDDVDYAAVQLQLLEATEKLRTIDRMRRR